MNLNKLIIIVCLIGAAFAIYLSNPNVKYLEWSGDKQSEVVQSKTDNDIDYDISQEYKNTDDIINITVNYPPSLSYKSKTDIFKMRKQYVSQSIFNNQNYDPSESVFGQIVSGKPWMSVNPCDNPGQSAHSVTGPSEEGRWIANPAMLVAIEYPFFLTYENVSGWCNSPSTQLIPKKISYDAKNNEISVVYSILPIITKNDFYTFNGVNARDFGYKYAYIDPNKSTYVPEFTQSDNISNMVYEFQNFIHLGSSCGVKGGCNNGSPRQTSIEFLYKKPKYEKNNAFIYIKLWKNRPKSKDDSADIVEKIIFEKV